VVLERHLRYYSTLESLANDTALTLKPVDPESTAPNAILKVGQSSFEVSPPSIKFERVPGHTLRNEQEKAVLKFLSPGYLCLETNGESFFTVM
jgi:hypothetical protein